MKHDAWRHDAAQYTATYDIPARYADVDTLRHLNNSALHGLHQEARMRFLAERIGDGFWRERGPRLLARRVTTDFLLESQYPQVLQAAVRVTALDDAQLVLASALFQHGRCVGLQTTSCAAGVRGQLQPMPPAWQQALDSPVPAPAGDSRWSAPVLPQWGQFPQQRELDARYADLDATGRTSETALMRCAEQGRSALLREAFAQLEVRSRAHLAEPAGGACRPAPAAAPAVPGALAGGVWCHPPGPQLDGAAGGLLRRGPGLPRLCRLRAGVRRPRRRQTGGHARRGAGPAGPASRAGLTRPHPAMGDDRRFAVDGPRSRGSLSRLDRSRRPG
jgi:acyl-CoA thioester hydrolase